MKTDLSKWATETNLCEYIDEKELDKMGQDIVLWFEEDEDDRTDWSERNEQWLKLATQVNEKKNTPWPNAANVKYPLLTTAAMQFAARAYPALVPGPNLVQGLVIGRDEGGLKQQSAERVGRHLSYQLLFDMGNWEEDMDRLCLMLPIIGCIFKKTYFDPIKSQNISELVLPSELVIDYYAKCIEEATRVSHVIYRNKNQVEERVRKGIFQDVDLGEPVTEDKPNEAKEKISGMREPETITPATPHKFIECHTFWDLDDDGYSEPYIITVHCKTRKVVRVLARFTEKDIEQDDKGKVLKIEPTQYFTKFGFIPNPDGSIYDLGFGLLLGALNEAVNTLTNQLLDSGSLHILQAGFLGRGIRVRGGNSNFRPGEWKPADFTGDDIKKHIFPLPTKEPSDVLFKLLETLVTSGKELASVAEIFVGKMPGQNTPATTTMATIEQGLKVFTAIYKRIYRALGKEYEKLFKLNEINLDKKVFFTINEMQGTTSQEVDPHDYDSDNISVKPFADPNIVSSAQKLMKVQAMGPLLALQTINPQEYTKRFLEAIEAENITALMTVQPKPDPEQQKIQMEMQQSQEEHKMDMEMEKVKLFFEQQTQQMKLEFEKMKLALKAQESQLDIQTSRAETQNEMQLNQATHEQGMEMQEEQHQMDKQLSTQEHKQGMQQSKEQHQLKQQQMKEKANAGAGDKGRVGRVASKQGNTKSTSRPSK
jgi:chaperonin GroES